MRRSTTCPNCGHIIDSKQSTCNWCGAPRPRSRGRVMQFLRGEGGADPAVQAITVLTVAYYLLSLYIGRGGALSASLLGFLSPGNDSLLVLGATGTVPVLQMGRYSSLIAASYLHGGLLHILFNMMALRQIGPWVSAEFGASRMFAIYTLSGVAGFVLSCLAGVAFTIGASASVCGLIGALFFFGKSRGGNYGAAVSREVSGWLISLFLFGFIIPGINNWGHGGGIIGGAVLAKLLGYSERRRETGGHRMLALVCLFATLLILAWYAYLALSLLRAPAMGPETI